MISFINTENFKKLGTVNIDLSLGTNLVLGDNAQGKTTVFNAVRFALYGMTAIESPKDDIPTWGETKCRVTVGFTGRFIVSRTLTDCRIWKAAEDGSLRQDDELKVAEGTSPCTAWVKEYFGLTCDMFDIFNMSMQGETAALITLGATKLNQVVEEYSGVGILDKVIKSVSQGAAAAERQLQGIEQVDLTPLEEKVVQLKHNNTSLSTDYGIKSDEAAAALSRRQEAKTALTNAIKHNALVEKLSLDTANLTGQIAATKSALETCIEEANIKLFMSSEDAEKMQIDSGKLSANLAEFKRDSDQHTFMSDNLEELKLSESKLISLVPVEESQKRTLQDLELKLASLTENYASLKATYDADNVELGKLKYAVDHASCPTCNRGFDGVDVDAAKDKHSWAMKRLAQSKLKLDNELERIRLAKLGISKFPSKFDSAEQLEQKQLEIARAEQLITNLETKWATFDDDAASSKFSDYTQKLTTYTRQLADKVQAEKRVANCTATLDKLTEQLNALPNVGDKVATDELQKADEEAENCLEAVKEEANKLLIELNNCSHELKAAELEFNRAIEQNLKITNLSLEVDQHKRLVKFLRDTRTEYMDGVWALILGAATDFVNTTTDGWITAIGRNDSGMFTFTENGIIATVRGSASGAQKEFIGVALRVGLGLALQGDKSLLMLDEPTAGMREENADKLASGLLSVKGQKIIITHRQSERLTAANIINL